MKLRIYSDTHLNCYTWDKMWYPPELPDDKETILILAGDIWEGTKFIEHAGHSWIGNIAHRFKHILIVLGNHDYWPCKQDITIKDGSVKLNSMLQDYGFFNVTVLDCDTFEIEDTLFIGATLWTDMKKGDPIVMHNMSNIMAYDGKIAYETGQNGAWTRFTSQKWIVEHDRHRRYIEHVVKQNQNKKLVVITHHLPLSMLSDPYYKGEMSDFYYHSDLHDIIMDANITMWVFGHSHYNTDQVWFGTRFKSNCLGYQGEHFEQQEYVKHEVIEI